ncbi:hypothetical protein FRC10_000034 [Ceratobasidium sp. 414]|nr:hypothetical protein FRC10_000034 [Ceratobasidium sp. 414]
MENDDGNVSDTPVFKLQGQSDRTPSPGSSSNSSSITPDSSPSSRFGSGPPSPEGNDDEAESRGDKGDKDEAALKATGKLNDGMRLESNLFTFLLGRERPSGTYTSNASASTNTSLPTITGSATLSLLPSATNRALVATTDNNKPSAVAIVVPLAIFAAALAGLIFSLRQRSKARREIERRNSGTQDGPSLHRAASKESSSAASGNGAGLAGKTDLERAMEFISGVQVPKSPNLTPLPPTIESKRRARMQNKLEQDDASQANRAVGTEIQTAGAQVPPAAGRPVEILYPGSYYGPGFPYNPALYQLPTIPRAVPLIDPSTYAALVPGNGFRPGTSQVMVGVPPGPEPKGNILGVELPRPPTVIPLPYLVEQHYQSLAPTVAAANQEAQTHMHSDASQPVEFAPPTPAPVATSVQTMSSLPPVASSTMPLPPPPTLPASLRVAQPQPHSSLQHNIGDELCAEPAQLRSHKSVHLSVGPDIPYATRPPPSDGTASNTLPSLPNPYVAIAMALRAGG